MLGVPTSVSSLSQRQQRAWRSFFYGFLEPMLRTLAKVIWVVSMSLLDTPIWVICKHDYGLVPIRTPHVWRFELSHTREGTSILINVCEATTRCICACFDALLMKVIRYTTDYGALCTKDVDHGSVVCHPVDETIPHHQSPFRYVHATKCQPYFEQNWVFSTNELMTHN